jgi:UPF0755 protein
MRPLPRLLIFIAIGFLAVFLAFCLFEWSAPRSARQEFFVVSRGQNILQVAQDLRSQSYIKSKIVFISQAFFNGDYKRIKAGKYKLAQGLDDREILAELVSGQNVPKYLTVIPGWTIKDISKTLEKNGICEKEEFLASALPAGQNGSKAEAPSLAEKFDFLSGRPEGAGLEGYFFPDTYQFIPGSALDDFLEASLSNFGRKLTPGLREEIKDKQKTIFQIITMASLLEKEVKTLEDKKIVSGILWKRAEHKLPLEVDSSLLYFLVSDHPDLEDKNADSLYNTYKYGGLPAGPICNPGLDSILAAIYPQESDYWFYLTAKDGQTIFSKNYGEHLINKAKYLDN